jgi:micrococcal nuclease
MPLLFIFCLFSVALCADHTYGSATVDSVLSVYDGDTFFALIKSWPPVAGERIGVRVYGIDTPEMKDHSPTVRALAYRAKALAVTILTKANRVELRDIRRDKYFRLLAVVYCDSVSLADTLINSGLARPYDGGKKKQW